MQPRWGRKWRAGAVSLKMSKELFSVFRPSPKQLLHRCWWLPQTDARQWHGGGPADRATSAGWHRQPHGGEEECHSAHRQWPQPRGVEAEEGASERAGHCLWTSAEGKWEPQVLSASTSHLISPQSHGRKGWVWFVLSEIGVELQDRELAVHPQWHNLYDWSLSLCLLMCWCSLSHQRWYCWSPYQSSASLGMHDLPSDTTGLTIISGCLSKPRTVITIKYHTS